MSEAAPAPDTAAESGATVVQFSPNTAKAEFNDTPHSDWAFAGQHGPGDGEALDTIAEEAITLPTLAVLATLVASEAEMLDATENPLIAFAPAVDSEDAGTIMWSGEDLADAAAPAPIESFETVVLLPDVTLHGISLDWTDPLYS